MRIVFTVVLALLAGLLACTRESSSPDQIRKDAADATAKLRTDTRAAAEGVREGWKRGELVDINSASRAQLASLPGLDDTIANRILAHRPYSNTQELVTRRVLSKNDYDRIRDEIEVKK